MKHTGLRNQSSYNLTEHRDNSPIQVDFQKGVIKNLREQSPFKEGTRNKDWINPTMSSNVLFYNHGHEEASNHHARPPKTNKKGYNLNHYVAFDANVKGNNVQHQVNDNSARVRTVDGIEIRSNSPNYKVNQKQHFEEQREHFNNRRQSPISSEQRISVDRDRSPRVSERRIENQDKAVAIKSQDISNSQKLRSTSPINAEKRSAHLERQNERSNRSNSVQAVDNNRSLSKSHSNQNIRQTEGNQMNHSASNNDIKQENGMHRSQSALSVQNQYGEYLKATLSNVSNPDNLICDYCVNQNMHDGKIQSAQAMKQRDVEHNNLIQDSLKRQIEDEKRRQLEKLKLYQESIDAQKNDLNDRKKKAQQLRDIEDNKIREMINENNKGNYEKEQKAYENKQRYINELNEQMGKNYEVRQQKYFNELEQQKKNDNLLINDTEREMKRRLINDQYKKNIRSQLEEQMKAKEGKKDQDKQQDEAYRRKVQEMIGKDVEARRVMDKMKRDAFLNDVDRHLALREDLKNQERDEKQTELDNVRRKIMQEKELEQAQANQKRNKLNGYINDLNNQMADRSAEKQLKAEQDKVLTGTTLLIHQKTDKCYNCAKCRKNYPLKHLNKHKRMTKAI